MRQASARAAAKPARGGTPNALFVWSAAERLPPELTGVTRIESVMPWGSLLRAFLGRDSDTLAGLARACRAGATFLVAVNLHAWRPPAPEVADLPVPVPSWAREHLTPRYASAGWRLTRARLLTAPEVGQLHSSWARRLRSSRSALDVLAMTGTIAG